MALRTGTAFSEAGIFVAVAGHSGATGFFAIAVARALRTVSDLVTSPRNSL